MIVDSHCRSPSSRGPGRGPFKAKTRVRIPLGTPDFHHGLLGGFRGQTLGIGLHYAHTLVLEAASESRRQRGGESGLLLCHRREVPQLLKSALDHDELRACGTSCPRGAGPECEEALTVGRRRDIYERVLPRVE